MTKAPQKKGPTGGGPANIEEVRQKLTQMEQVRQQECVDKMKAVAAEMGYNFRLDVQVTPIIILEPLQADSPQPAQATQVDVVVPEGD